MRSAHFGKAILWGWWLAVSCSGVLEAQEGWRFPDFSATQVLPMGHADITMKVAVSGASVRLERSAAFSTLYLPASHQVYNLTVYPDKTRSCVAMRADEAQMLPSPLELIQGKIRQRTMVGSAVVDGHPTRVEDVEVEVASGATVRSRVWQAEDLEGIPVKIESHLEHSTLQAQYRDIVIGQPEPALFAPPSRCTPLGQMWQVAETKPGK
jgi:hypothetical protein